MPEPAGIDDWKILQGMWLECADDLRRWAKAFTDRTTMTVDADTCKELERLAKHLEEKASHAL